MIRGIMSYKVYLILWVAVIIELAPLLVAVHGIHPTLKNNEDQIALFVVYDHRPTERDIAILKEMPVTISYVCKYINVVCLRNVPSRLYHPIASLPGVVKIELQPKVYPLLDISARALRARPSQYYTDNVWQSLGITGSGVGVAIVDSGVDDGHEALLGKYVAGVDFSHPGVIVYVNPDDSAGHGTHVAGIVMSTGGSDGIYKGIAPGANLIDLKVINNMGDTWADTIIMALEWCIENKTKYNIKVVNLSLGSRVSSDGSDVQSEMVNTVVDNGIVVVAAMGNDGLGNFVPSPAAADKAIAVGATTDVDTVVRDDDYVDSYSNTGPRTDDGDADPYDELKPDVVVPGTNITSCMHSFTSQDAYGYITYTGTSMATPHVAGIVALMLEANPYLTPEMVKTILHETAENRGTPYDPLLSPKYNTSYGYGIADAYGATKRALDLTSGDVEVPTIVDTRQTIKVNLTMNYTRTRYIVGNEVVTIASRTPQEWGRPSNIILSVEGNITYTSSYTTPAMDSNGDWYFVSNFYFNESVADTVDARVLVSYTTTAPFNPGEFRFSGEYYINQLMGTNATATVNVRQGNEKPDLSVNKGAITFSPSQPQDGDSVVISARINNTGSIGTTAKIAFYDGLPSSNTLIDTDEIYVPAKGYDYASVTWTATAGMHTIYVVCDPDDEVDESNEFNNTASKSINVGGTNIPPVAILKVDKNDVSKGESVEFDGSQSYDIDGNVVEYFFDFGDGSDSGWVTSSKVTHIYETEGQYVATLKVKDNGGAESTNTARVNITVRRGRAITYYLGPEFQLTETAPTGSIDYEINCPKGTLGPFGGLLEWQEVGTWTVSLGPRTIIEDIPVKLWVMKKAQDLMTTLRIRATGMLNGNEITNTDTAILPILQVNQSHEINLTLTLNNEVSVDAGDVLGIKIECLTDSDSIYLLYYSKDHPSNMVVVADIPVLKSPIADCGGDKNAYVGDSVEFDASHSYDPDGTIVQYKWDFDGDGTWDVTSDKSKATHIYTEVGTYQVTLEVMDNDGLTDKDTCVVNVVEKPANIKPTVTIEYPENGTTLSGTVVIKGTASDQDGAIKRVEIAIDDQSWARATGGEEWSYTWNTKDVDNGIHTLKARAYDGEDYSPIDMIQVVVNNTNTPPVILDSTVSPGIVDNSGTYVVTVTAKVKDADGKEDISMVYCDLSSFGLSEKTEMNDEGLDGDSIKGDDIYTTTFTVIKGLPPGQKSLTIHAIDTDGAHDMVSKTITVMEYNSPPKILEVSVDPKSVTNSGKDRIVIMVEVQDDNGLDNIKRVYADLSKLKGDSYTELYDDGMNSDEYAGDGIYTLEYRVPFTVEPGEYRIMITVVDYGDLKAYDNITVEVTEMVKQKTSGKKEVKNFIPGFSFSGYMTSLIFVFLVLTVIVRKRQRCDVLHKRI